MRRRFDLFDAYVVGLTRMLSDAELAKIMPHLAAAKREQYLPLLNAAMAEGQINTRLRVAAFVAQITEESGEFRWLEEIASGAAYEGRADLGNTEPGDGRRFKGRGVIMVTGRVNYRHYGQVLGLPLETNPAMAADPKVAFRLAAAYWTEHDCNALADGSHFEAITRKINGGLTGEATRVAYYERALAVLQDTPPTTIMLNGRRLQPSSVLTSAGQNYIAVLELRQVGADVVWDERSRVVTISVPGK